MKLQVHVVCEDLWADFVIQCGDGRKTIKWLALTAAQRFTSRAPHGAKRHRERRMLPMIGSRYQPANVRSARSDMHPPDCYLRDELDDEDEVEVELAATVGVSPVGTADLTKWATLAFARTDAQLTMRRRVLEDREAEEEEARRARAEEERVLRAAAVLEKSADMRRILENQLLDESHIANEMAELWHKCNLFGNVDKLTSDEEVQAKIYQLFERNFVALQEIFKYYCATGSGEGTNSLEYMEFTTFIADMQNAFRVASQTQKLQKVFINSVCQSGEKRNINAEIGMHEFFLALVLLAMENPGRGNDQLIRGRQRELPDIALEKFLNKYVLPLVDSKLVGASVKSALTNNEILATFYDYNIKLVEVFERYAASVEDNKASGFTFADSLNIAEFERIVFEADLAGSSGGEIDDQLTTKEIRQAFSGAQAGHDFQQVVKAAAADGNEEGGGAPGPAEVVNDDQQMDYPEFLEAIARIGVLKWEDDRILTHQKIEGALAAVARLADQPR